MSPVLVSRRLKQRHILSSGIILVPYSRHLVPKYNQWMQNAELQFLTGSEPLTLAEEYEMYEAWTADTNKCTFIVLDRAKFDSLPVERMTTEQRQIESMVGDVNFYVQDADEAVAEIEIMIAEVAARGRGFGKQAALVMMHFAHHVVGIRRFEAKIKMSNTQSQRLFAEYFGFRECSRSTVFEEITYECDLSEEDCKLKQLFDGCPLEHQQLLLDE